LRSKFVRAIVDLWCAESIAQPERANNRSENQPFSRRFSPARPKRKEVVGAERAQARFLGVLPGYPVLTDELLDYREHALLGRSLQRSSIETEIGFLIKMAGHASSPHVPSSKQ
jgi:hypothetical protein